MDEPTSELMLRPFLGDCAEFPGSPAIGNAPKELVVFELDFGCDGNGSFHIFFSRCWGPSIIKDEKDFKQQLLEIVNNKMPKLNKITKKDPKDPPLSLRADKNRYIIYKLTDKNWQFTQAGFPFKIATDINNKGIYYEARRVTPQGDIQIKGDQNTVGDLSRIAYFISNGYEMVHNPGSRPKYPHGLNIIVDFYDEVSGTAMPIMIDPDIRFPGGTTLEVDEP
ncbi:hypothetical protein BH10PSE14_BH10PSE14_39490 [soil metagenome]